MDKSSNSVFLRLFSVLLFWLGIFYGYRVTAQKYAFAHYDIEDGLIQSQVNNFCEDSYHRLWIATLGGLCRYDGHEYFSVSKATGLANNFVYTNYTDSKGTLWIGTQKGLSSYDGQKTYNYAVPAGVRRTYVLYVTGDKAGNVWALMDNSLYRVTDRQMKKIALPDSLGRVIAITTDKAGSLYGSFWEKGVYKFIDNKWQLFAKYDNSEKRAFVFKIQFDRFNYKKLYLLGLDGLFLAEGGKISPVKNKFIDAKNGPLLSFDQDDQGNLWIGAQRGAYLISKQKTVHFNRENGLTNIAVSAIYCDRDQNVWLGTQGNGIYRYEGGNHLLYDNLPGATASPVVTSIAHDMYGDILLGTAGNGIIKYNDGVPAHLWSPKTNPGIAFVQSMCTDNNKNVWIGTDRSGIWRYNGSAFDLLAGTEHSSVNVMAAGNNNTLWIGTPGGAYYYENNKITPVKGISSFTSSIYPVGRDSVFIGTQEGLKLVIDKRLVGDFKLGALSSSSIMCILNYRDNLLFGVDDGGMYLWNRKYGILKNYTTKDGFLANTIYSLVADSTGNIWAGTGRGVNRITIDPRGVTCTIKRAGDSKDLLAEANQNAALCDNGKVFFGTTKGLLVLNTAGQTMTEKAPSVLIQGVKVFTGGDKGAQVIDKTGFNNLKLPASQNHVVIAFAGIYLRNPGEVTYQYRLSGLSNDFGPLVKSNTVDYSSLPPGRYTFEVRAFSPDDKIPSRLAKLNFEIAPHFYQQPAFRVIVVFLLILFGFALQYFLQRRKAVKKLSYETMKREEKQKLRQQTAEDFHDDLGNKLTRITVLTDVLNTKLGPDKPDQKSLVEQIQQNAAALYTGTRDILWALDPKSDNLYEILMHIKETGVELFHDVNIDFSFDGIEESYSEIKLPMEYSRNITMIFKELLTNVLKHSGAHNVSISLSWPVKTMLFIRLTDDGKGYDENRARRGHGLVNIKARARRIDSLLSIESIPQKGTTAELQVKINVKPQ
ncbi:MAG: ligand-binding sensor domain-containing protein [Mucilaginibacter sp.]